MGDVSQNGTSWDLLVVQVPATGLFLKNPSLDGVTKQALRRLPIVIELSKIEDNKMKRNYLFYLLITGTLTVSIMAGQRISTVTSTCTITLPGNQIVPCE
jgi:hypothetical protein